MIKKLKTLILSLSLLFSFATPMVMAAPVFAADGLSQTDINKQLKCGSNIDLNNATGGCTNTDVTDNGNGFTNILKKIINILSILIGAIAVIMIIIGGFRYVTSAGNESGVTAAKKTIMYALIGLVIVALAQVIVHFVLANIA